MKNNTIIFGLSVTILSTIALPAFAEDVPTMNQPDNGFYEGANPEWATLHSTDSRGTELHRKYHRDAVRSLNVWLQEHRDERTTAGYYNDHRIFVQERNASHREFHTAGVEFNISASADDSVISQYDTENTLEIYTSGRRQSRRLIIAEAERQNRRSQSR